MSFLRASALYLIAKLRRAPINGEPSQREGRVFSQLYLSVHEALPNGSVNSTLKNILDLLGDKAELAKAADGWTTTDTKGATQALIQAYILALLQGYRQNTDWVPFTLVGSPSMPLPSSDLFEQLPPPFQQFVPHRGRFGAHHHRHALFHLERTSGRFGKRLEHAVAGHAAGRYAFALSDRGHLPPRCYTLEENHRYAAKLPDRDYISPSHYKIRPQTRVDATLSHRTDFKDN